MVWGLLAFYTILMIFMYRFGWSRLRADALIPYSRDTKALLLTLLPVAVLFEY